MYAIFGLFLCVLTCAFKCLYMPLRTCLQPVSCLLKSFLLFCDTFITKRHKKAHISTISCYTVNYDYIQCI